MEQGGTISSDSGGQAGKPQYRVGHRYDQRRVSKRGANENTDDWIGKADKALYCAKQLGCNRVVC